VRLMLTVIGVKGYSLAVDPTRFDSQAIDRDALIIAPEATETYDRFGCHSHASAF
jgi:hypothetical protein